MKRIVVDASVVLKWYLSDENCGNFALEILDKYVSYNVEILAPSLLEYEVINGLLFAQKRGRIEEEALVAAVEGFKGLEIEQKTLSFFSLEVLHFSKSYDLSAYDSCYLAVANIENAQLITADEALYNKVKKDLKWVKWLGDFSV